jgi:hypothetical protein
MEVDTDTEGESWTALDDYEERVGLESDQPESSVDGEQIKSKIVDSEPARLPHRGKRGQTARGKHKAARITTRS